VARDGDDAFAVGQYDMLRALTSDSEAGLLEGTYSAPMRYAGDTWHDSSDGNVDFTALAATKLLVNDGEVRADRVSDVG